MQCKSSSQMAIGMLSPMISPDPQPYEGHFTEGRTGDDGVQVGPPAKLWTRLDPLPKGWLLRIVRIKVGVEQICCVSDEDIIALKVLEADLQKFTPSTTGSRLPHELH